jgi:hypothetical protein
MRDVRAYLQYKVIKSGSSYATKELDEAFFDFYSRKLNGQEEQKSGQKRTVDLVTFHCLPCLPCLPTLLALLSLSLPRLPLSLPFPPPPLSPGF